MRTSDLLSVVYAIDLSDSIGEGSTETALQFMATTVNQKPERDQSGLVVFGRNAAAELPPRQAFPFDSGSVSINSHVDRGATNIEQALSLSAAMLPEENAGRIVLVTDGAATEGSLTRILDDLKSRDIAVDVLPVQYDYSKEVWLERLDLPRFVKLGDNYEAVIVLSSLQNGSGRLVVREQGRRDLGAVGRLPRARTVTSSPSSCASRATTNTQPRSKRPTAPTTSSRTTPSSTTST